jgi:hypothetical protein
MRRSLIAAALACALLLTGGCASRPTTEAQRAYAVEGSYIAAQRLALGALGSTAVPPRTKAAIREAEDRAYRAVQAMHDAARSGQPAATAAAITAAEQAVAALNQHFAAPAPLPAPLPAPATPAAPATPETEVSR